MNCSNKRAVGPGQDWQGRSLTWNPIIQYEMFAEINGNVMRNGKSTTKRDQKYAGRLYKRAPYSRANTWRSPPNVVTAPMTDPNSPAHGHDVHQ